MLVEKGVGQWCLIGHGVSLGVEGTQGQVMVKGMGRHGHGHRWLLVASKGWHGLAQGSSLGVEGTYGNSDGQRCG